jgi:Trk K+ transport system NAD-binding subunit
MINRNEKIIAPQGSTKIFPGDVLYILVKNEMIEMVVSNILKHFDQKKYAINET